MKLIDAKKILWDKVKYIILTGLICALCAAGFKYLFTPVTSVNSDFVYNRIIRVENEQDFSNPKFEFNYVGIINTNNGFLKFIAQTDGKIFDFGRINSSWKRMNEKAKVEWLRKRVWMQGFHDNVFEIVFTVPSSNISDLAYLEKNSNSFMDAFVKSGEELIREIKPHTTIKTVNSSVILPKEIQNDKKKIALKNAFYGFIAGIFLSSAIFIGIPLFKEI